MRRTSVPWTRATSKRVCNICTPARSRAQRQACHVWVSKPGGDGLAQHSTTRYNDACEGASPPDQAGVSFGKLAVAVFGTGFGEPGAEPDGVAVDDDLLPGGGG